MYNSWDGYNTSKQYSHAWEIHCHNYYYFAYNITIVILLKDMNCWLCPEGNKREMYTSKLKDEVGMAGPKSTQTRL
jgi:hypothetical protein